MGNLHMGYIRIHKEDLHTYIRKIYDNKCNSWIMLDKHKQYSWIKDDTVKL